MATLQLKTLMCIETEDNWGADDAYIKVTSSLKHLSFPLSGVKMKILLVMTLVFAATLTANAQTGEGKSEAEIAVQKAMTELGPAMSKLKVLDESNKKLARSNQAQSYALKMLDKLERKIQYEDAPALSEKIVKFNEKRARVLASGCPEEATEVATELANRCNPLIDEINKKHAELAAAKENQNKQLQTIKEMRQAAYTTTFENAVQQKKNNAAFEDLLAKKLELYKQVITRSMSIVKSKAAAIKACESLPLEKAHCCLSVVNDRKNPAECNVELLFKLLEKAGAFSTTEVKPAN